MFGFPIQSVPSFDDGFISDDPIIAVDPSQIVKHIHGRLEKKDDGTLEFVPDGEVSWGIQP
jgi:hypothetical protein